MLRIGVDPGGSPVYSVFGGVGEKQKEREKDLNYVKRGIER